MIPIEQYYVQQFARQSIELLVPIPDKLEIPEKYRSGIDNSEFVSAFHTYQEIINQIYIDVSSMPESFGMACLPIENNPGNYHYGLLGPVTPNENKSRKSFFRLPNVLLALASVGELTPDGGLAINVTNFKNFKNQISSVKITTPEPILERMVDYGFEFEGMPDNFSLRNISHFTLYYPDNRNLLIVLKAFKNIGYYEHFLSVDYRYMLSDNFNFDLNDILRICGNGINRSAVLEIYNKLMEENYIAKVEYHGGFFGKLRFYKSKSKKEFLTVYIERNFDFKIDIRLSKIDSYANKIESLSASIQQQLVLGRDCINCGVCKDGSTCFTYKGNAYRKCSVICCGFSLSKLKEEDIPSVLQLLDLEIKA